MMIKILEFDNRMLTPDGRYSRIFDNIDTESASFLSQSFPYKYSSKSRKAAKLEKFIAFILLFESADATDLVLRYFLYALILVRSVPD